MPLGLDDLLNDGRLARLFTTDARHCALQLWILQIKSGQSIENRLVHGRLLPYSYSNDCWSATDDDNFQGFRQAQAQVIRLNLYVKSSHCAELLRQLSIGRSVSAISEELKLGLSGTLKARFGAVALAADKLVYRPVAYLLNRDAHDPHSPSSPHGGAGAFSASITQTHKGALFRLGGDYDVVLTRSVVKHVNADTGLDFGGADMTRFGDLELLVFPALDDVERRLLSVGWADDRRTLAVRFNPMQVPHFIAFQFRLNIQNDGQIVYSCVAMAERDVEGLFECRFELSDEVRTWTDSTDVEIYGYHDEHSREGSLCCRWRVGYIREISLQGNALGHSGQLVKFDWLEKTTKPSSAERVKTALTIGRGNMGFKSRVGGREADPWVPSNRDLSSLFARLHPPKSEGRFFLRWGQSDGEGRLQFVEWFKSMLAKYPQHQIVIFDPYFEDAGLGLLLLSAELNSEFIIFRSLPKSHKTDDVVQKEFDKSESSGVDNLVANCENNRSRLRRIKLRIYGLKYGRLHDRYILIVGPDRLPVAGFNLSNSFQKATENYPLLVTPIPADVLLKVEQYKSELVREAEAGRSDDEAEQASMRLLFDSTEPADAPSRPQRYEPFRFFEKPQAGDVLSIWTGEPSLKGLNGDPLKERMAALDLVRNDSLVLPETGGLCHCLRQQAGNFADFTAAWEVLGDVLAHSSAGDSRLREVESEHGFLQFLAQFLEASFDRPNDQVDKELAVMDHRLFLESLEALLHSSRHPHHFFHPTKYAALTWPEYFAIRLLWWYAPDVLLATAETKMADLPERPQIEDVVRLSLLSQIVSEIALAVQFDINEGQRDRLVRCGNSLLQWMGLNAIEMQLEKPGGLATVSGLAATLAHSERVRLLGWMVQHAARNPNKAEIYQGLVAALHDALPASISSEELRYLVDSMRGHMRQLAWAEPWLSQDVIFPILQDGRANMDDACDIWVQELISMLEWGLKHQALLFERAREGQTTNIAAYLFAHSGPGRRQACLKSIKAVLRRQRRIVQQPLASTSDWTRWNGGLVVSMWTLTFTRWAQYYLRGRGVVDGELEELSRDACELAMVRPMSEWRSNGVGKEGELAAFFDQVEGLLAPNDESGSLDR